VRITKFWRNKEKWATKANRPASYLLELLALRTYQQNAPSLLANMGKKTNFDILAALFQIFLRNITELSSNTFICWNTHYSEEVARNNVMIKSNKPFNPIVVDPANPTNNVANRLDDWMPFISYAQKTLLYFDNCELARLRKETEFLKQELDAQKQITNLLMKRVFCRSLNETYIFDTFQPTKDFKDFELAGLMWRLRFKEEGRCLMVVLDLLSESKLLNWNVTVTCKLTIEGERERDYSNYSFGSDYSSFGQLSRTCNATFTFKPSEAYYIVKDVTNYTVGKKIKFIFSMDVS